MKPFSFKIEVNNTEQALEKILKWAHSFDTCALFNSNKYPNYPYSNYDCLFAIGNKEEKTAKSTPWKELKSMLTHSPNWWFGFLGYDLKNSVENLKSNNSITIDYPDYFFFVPEYIITINDQLIEVHSDLPFEKENWNSIVNYNYTPSFKSKIELQSKISEQEYLEKLERILSHIRKGDIYEINFCQEFYAENVSIDPLETYLDLNRISKTPFSGFLKIRDKFLISASPERFLKRKGNKVISQPIKGTAKRGSNPIEDQEIKLALQQSLKDTTENIMIVDLVRNDLSKTNIPGSVKVEELNHLYTFEQVHQLISTISSEVDSKTHSIDIISNAFPMGSMTGAPKVKAMELIEEYESTKRGIFSGAMGFFSPTGDFDFNVIIRSIMYDGLAKKISIQVGGAITYDSIPEAEYEECSVKINALIKVLQSNS